MDNKHNNPNPYTMQVITPCKTYEQQTDNYPAWLTHYLAEEHAAEQLITNT